MDIAYVGLELVSESAESHIVCADRSAWPCTQERKETLEGMEDLCRFPTSDARSLFASPEFLPFITQCAS